MMRTLSAVALAVALLVAPAGPAFAAELTDTTSTAETTATEPTGTETTTTETTSPSPAETTTAETTTVETTTTAPVEPTGTTEPTPTNPEPTTTTPVAPTTDPTSTTEPTATTEPPTPVFYTNCDQVHHAGHALLFWWETGYRDRLDRDNDGIACEFGDRVRPGHRHIDWDKADRRHNRIDSSPADNDSRPIIVTIKGKDGKNGTDGKDGADGSNGSSSTASSIADTPNPVYTQWRTVPSGGIATGDPA